MYEKAKRDFDRMKSSPDIDAVVNSYFTAYHIMDYVKAQGKASSVAIDAFYKDPDFQMCNHICNKSKHLRKGDPLTTHHSPGAVFGRAMFGEVAFGEAPSDSVVVKGRRVEVIPLGQRVLEKWERFFKDNGI